MSLGNRYIIKNFFADYIVSKEGSFDIDDVILNTLGALMGLLFTSFLERDKMHTKWDFKDEFIQKFL